MRLQKITIHNFGSFFGTHELSLEGRGLCLVLGDNCDEPRMNSNGAGKSTAFDALDWCLFGKVPREDHVDSVINQEAGAGCQVEVSLLDDDGSQVSVTRWRKMRDLTTGQNGLMLKQDGKDLTSLDTVETQRRVESILGLDRDTFHAAVLFGQTDLLRFADAKDSERLAILTKILQLESIDEYLLTAKTHAKAINQELEVELVSDRVAKGKIETLTPQIAELEQHAAAYSEERAQKLREATRQYNEYATAVAEQEKVAALEQRVRGMEQQALTEQRHCVLDLSDFDQRISGQSLLRDQHKDKLARITGEGNRLKAWRAKAEALQGTCQTCAQPIPPEHAAAEVAKVDRELEQLRVDWGAENTNLVQVESELARIQAERDTNLQAHHAADKENNRVWMEIQAQLKQVADAKTYLERAKPHMETLQKAMTDAVDKPNPFTEQVEKVKAAIAEAENQRLQIDTRIKSLQVKLALWEFWVTGFGPQGLKNYILDTRLAEMTAAVNQWVHLLSGGTIWVRFETQRLARSSKKLSNKLTIRVFRYNPDGSTTERNYRSWSGGEKQRVSLGIDFGLSRLIANRSAKRYDVVILDELFRHLDTAGREAVIDLLTELRKEKSSVIVVDHDQTFQDAFENRLLVRKSHGRSAILEVDDAKEKSYATQSH